MGFKHVPSLYHRERSAVSVIELYCRGFTGSDPEEVILEHAVQTDTNRTIIDATAG